MFVECLLLVVGVAQAALVTLINDDFTGSMSANARLLFSHAGDGSGDDWIKNSVSLWSTASGNLNNAATGAVDSTQNEGAAMQLYTVSSADTSLTSLTLTFDYTVGAGSTLYFHAYGWSNYTETDGQIHNTTARDGMVQNQGISEFSNYWNLKNGGTAVVDIGGWGDAWAIDGGVSGVSGTFSQVVDIASYVGINNITDIDYIALGFANNATVFDGTGAVSVDDFKLTAPSRHSAGLFVVRGMSFN